MIKYTKYNADTGNIEYIFTGNAEDAAANSPCIEGEYLGEEYTIINGSAVRKQQSEIDQAEIDFAWVELRNKRNNLLKDSDFTQYPDSPLSNEKKLEWQTYRSQLRDFPSNVTDPRNVVWPTKPTN